MSPLRYPPIPTEELRQLGKTKDPLVRRALVGDPPAARNRPSSRPTPAIGTDYDETENSISALLIELRDLLGKETFLQDHAARG
jgi:hypothetical protein